MRPYFEKMTSFGKALTEQTERRGRGELRGNKEGVEQQVEEAVEAVKNAGIPEEILKKRGQLTRMGKNRISHRPRHLVPPPYTL